MLHNLPRQSWLVNPRTPMILAAALHNPLHPRPCTSHAHRLANALGVLIREARILSVSVHTILM